ncbi:MAG: TOBE domain-containing protein [Trichlorobacter sp.]|jgi:hypothetical protein
MKKFVSVVAMAVCLSASIAFAGELKVTAVVDKVEMQGAQATVTLKEANGNKVTVIVKDQLTLDKLSDKRIVIGDEVRVKFDEGSKVSKLFRKTAGC